MVDEAKDPPKLRKVWERDGKLTYSPRAYLVSILEQYGGPKGAASELGVSQSSIYRWINAYRLRLVVSVLW